MGGTGLGLALSRHLAEAMGGNLDLQSQQGVGTKAILRLPLKKESVEIKDQFFSHQKNLSFVNPPKVLVVEDDYASNNILVNLLSDTGCQVDSAMDGREALQKASVENFDLIFTDIRMPDINGLELLAQLRQNPTYKHTPVIAVSASSLEHERDYYLEQGFQHFIGKPYSFDDIYLALINFAGAQTNEGSPSEIQDNRKIAVTVDLKAVANQLEMLLAYAVKGDMTNCKQLAAQLDETKLGSEAHRQLTSAIKGYNLEKVEALIKSWLIQ